jgi:hypothetical protein
VARDDPHGVFRRRPGGRHLCAEAAAAGCALSGVGAPPVVRAERPPSPAERIIAGLEATSVREVRLVGSFKTDRTFTVVHGGQTDARVVAALRFTAPDVKTFTVLENRGSSFIRTRVVDRMMAAEMVAARAGVHRSVAFTSDNYEFELAREDGDASVIAVKPRRRDELLFKGLLWIGKDGYHLKHIEGEPAKNPSFWTRRISCVSDWPSPRRPSR